MSMGNEVLATLTIPEDDTESEALSSHLSQGQVKTVIGALEQLLVEGPSALDNAVALHVSAEYPGVDFFPMQDYLGNPVEIPAAVSTVIPFTTFKDLKFVSAGVETAARGFTLLGKVSYHG